MQLILFSKFCHKRGGVDLCRPAPLALGVIGFLVLSAGLLSLGYQMGVSDQASPMAPDEQMLTMQSELDAKARELQRLQERYEMDMDALATRLGSMQAHMYRLDALGSRLTGVADLRKGEFDFDREPALGGPVDENYSETLKLDDFHQILDDLSARMIDRELQLAVLEGFLVDRQLNDSVSPSGRPVEGGWMSSKYGKRVHPITGKKHVHTGVDYAGDMGSDILAVASGVVTFEGWKGGYGKTLEVNHGNGVTTRYGHNKTHLVRVGDRVDKGQVIALMGSTGKSTGPHVHFEVIKNGRHTNPMKYIHAKK